MARIRSINPTAPMDEDVAKMSMAARYVWAYLPCHADREGRLKDSAFTLKLAILPADNVDMESILAELAAQRHIIRYSVDGRRYIQIRSFHRHQTPHTREVDSSIPAPPNAGHDLGSALASPGQTDTTTKEIPGHNLPRLSGSDPVPVPSPDLLSQSAREKPAGTPPPDPPSLPDGRVNGHGLAILFGKVRAQEVKGAMTWHVARDKENKADAIADAIADDPAACADVIPSMVLFFKRAKAGLIDANKKAVTDPSYGFACWVSAFTSLREMLSGSGPRQQQTEESSPYGKIPPLKKGVAPPPRPRP